MATFSPLLQQLSRKRARQHTEQLQLWAAKRRRTESQFFWVKWTKRWKKHRSFTRCGVLLSSNERKERGQNESRDGSWWASGYRNWNDFAFKKRFRVKRDTFDFLVQDVTHLLEKQPTRMNPEPVIPEKQLAICLYRLAHGSSCSTVEDLFGVVESTAAVIFNDVCRVLITIHCMIGMFTCQKVPMCGNRNSRTSFKTGSSPVLVRGTASMCTWAINWRIFTVSRNDIRLQVWGLLAQTRGFCGQPWERRDQLMIQDF